MSGDGKHCAIKRLVDRHFDGSIRPRDERKLREHLPDCAICRNRYQRHLLLSRLDPAALGAQERIARGLGLGGIFASLRGWFSPKAAAPMLLATATATAVVMFMMGERPVSDGFQPRGGPSAASVGFWAFRMAPGSESVELGNSIAADDELAFAYFAPPDAGAKHLLVFGVDEHRHVYWYYPAWTDPASTPSAIRIETGRHELGEAVSHALDGRELRLYAVFLDAPLDVRQVEASIHGDRAILEKAAWTHVLQVRPTRY